jgi:hypothetical protein
VPSGAAGVCPVVEVRGVLDTPTLAGESEAAPPTSVGFVTSKSVRSVDRLAAISAPRRLSSVGHRVLVKSSA